MRLARTTLSLSTIVITLAGVAAFGAEPPETSHAEPTHPVVVPTYGDCRLGVDVGAAVDTATSPETAPEVEAVLSALEGPCFAADDDAAVEAVTQLACDQPAQGGPLPFPASAQGFMCIDIFGDDCFAGCCGPRGQVRKWAPCCIEAGGFCTPGCQIACTQRYCSVGLGPR